MNIHEFQAKRLLSQFQVPVAPGGVCETVTQAVEVAKKLDTPLWVVKAQIHAGGRGKAGGVILTRSLTEVEKAAEKLLGSTLVTHQTGPKGQKVRRLYIEQGSSIKQELYLSLVLDRTNECVSMMASPAGGVDIEEVALKTPEKLTTVCINPGAGYQSFQGRKIGFALGLTGKQFSELDSLLKNLYNTFISLDAEQIEINPLVITSNDQLLALDAKISFDDNSLYRHPALENLRDRDEEDPMETKAHAYDLNYVKLDGNIGCMVNGAGLAMATMDIIKLHGGEPANFLDVGGGATAEKVKEAFKLILADPHVKAILINIFGGIMRCDIIAQGIVAAAQEIKLTLPLVVRLQGTNYEMGKKILEESGLTIESIDDLTQAASAVVSAARRTA